MEFIAAVVYNRIVVVIIALSVALIMTSAGGIAVLVVLVLLYLVGLVYITVVWDLACVVFALEPMYSLSPVKRSFRIKGKIQVSDGLVVIFDVLFLRVGFLL